MKRILTLTFVVALLGLFYACKPTTEDAIKYNDTIIGEQKDLQASFNDFEATFETYVPEEMSGKLADAAKQADKSLEVYKGLKDFDKKSDFKDAAVGFAEMYKDLAANEYVKLVENYSLPDSLYTTDVENECYELLDQIDQKYTKAYDKLVKAQKDFADAYEFEIEKSVDDIMKEIE